MKFIWYLPIICFSLFLVSCGGEEQETTEDNAEANTEELAENEDSEDKKHRHKSCGDKADKKCCKGDKNCEKSCSKDKADGSEANCDKCCDKCIEACATGDACCTDGQKCCDDCTEACCGGHDHLNEDGSPAGE